MWEGLIFRNASGWLVVSGSTKQIRGELTVNRRIAMGAELVFGRRGQWQARMGELVDVAY